jgi:hypothetical protein
VSCDVVAKLIFVSPTQINFLVPDIDGLNGSCENYHTTDYRIVLVQNGKRIDNLTNILQNPVMITIDPCFNGDYNMVFEIGYDCLFSTSISSPQSCGLSWTYNLNRVLIGAVTDAASGQLIYSKAPVHQGQLITLWMTGLYGGVTLNNKTGLMEQNPNVNPPFFVFVVPHGMLFGTTVWAGESPQFVGLDQANVVFPTCTTKTLATTEKRYDALLSFLNAYPPSGPLPDVGWWGYVDLYLPLLVRVGDPDCFF